MKFHEKNDFGAIATANSDISAKDVKIHNSHLVHAFLYEINKLPPQKSLMLSGKSLHTFIFIDIKMLL